MILAMAAGCGPGGCGPKLPPVQPVAAGTNATNPAKAARGAQTTEGVTKGFKYPEYDSQQRLKTMLTGVEARPQGDGIMCITGLKVETYNKDGTVEMIVEAPECFFDRKNNTARSAGSMEARSTSGMFRVTGEGFEWSQATGRLVITNNSKTEISKQLIDKKEPRK